MGIIGVWKAFDELEELGWIGRARPRLVAVHAARGGPVVKAFHAGWPECQPATDVPTIAPGIMVVKPFADVLILRALRATQGWAVEAGDDEIRHFMVQAGCQEGMWLSPEGAATVAGARRVVRDGQLGARQPSGDLQHRDGSPLSAPGPGGGAHRSGRRPASRVIRSGLV